MFLWTNLTISHRKGKAGDACTQYPCLFSYLTKPTQFGWKLGLPEFSNLWCAIPENISSSGAVWWACMITNMVPSLALLYSSCQHLPPGQVLLGSTPLPSLPSLSLAHHHQDFLSCFVFYHPVSSVLVSYAGWRQEPRPAHHSNAQLIATTLTEATIWAVQPDTCTLEIMVPNHFSDLASCQGPGCSLVH